MTNANLPPSHARGQTVFSVPASRECRALAAACDLGIAACAFFLGCLALGRLPPLSALEWLALALFAAASWLGQRFFLGVTLGERPWEIRTQARFKLNPPLVQPQPLRPATQSLGIFLTALALIGALISAYAAIAWHPLGARIGAESWEAGFPGQDSARWSVIPFFYSLGAWPKVFRDKEIFYSLPYEKGPPQRFAGKIVAAWDSPDVRLTIEGPKSPVDEDKAPYERERIRECFVGLWSGGLPGLTRFPGCLAIREAVLSRHLDEMARLGLARFAVSWVEVRNRALAPEQRLQGFSISAEGDGRGEERFVLVTPRGTEQAFILDYPLNDEGTLARETFREALRSLRVSDDLGPGKAWVDQSLEKVDLHSLEKQDDSDTAVNRLAEIQAMLVARISVDPKTFDTYYHLAGTALMLGRYAVKLRRLPPPQGDPARASQILGMARPMIRSAERYAEDIAPQDRRIALLQSFDAEAQKF